MIKLLLLLTLLFFNGCEEKAKPRVIIKPELQLPIKCLKLDKLDIEHDFLDELDRLYRFDSSCDLRLSISYKKNIICNSTSNVSLKATGHFPKSFLKLEVRKGMKSLYSYYIDLYSNVDRDDIDEGFIKLKRDLFQKSIKK